MASRHDPMVITQAKYDNIFGSSESEGDDELGEELDIDLGRLADNSSGSESDGSDSESEEEQALLEWTDNLTHITVDEFTSPTGITFELAADARQIDIFNALFDDDILAHIVADTNRYARQKSTVERLAKWSDVTIPKLKAYFSVCIVMGLNHLPSTTDYWSSNPYMGNEGIQKVMTKNRFEEIGRFLHFNDSSAKLPRGHDMHDRLYKVWLILTAFNNKLLEVYNPEKNISVDEGMIAFKGRLSFRQYMPAKPTKYGIKVWMAADASNGFVLKSKVFSSLSFPLNS